MGKKIVFIGAGSVVFTRAVVRDILTYPAFCDAEICLMDINEERLRVATACAERIRDAFGVPATVTATLSRADALQGADAVICTVFNGDVDVWRYDVEIPEKYGVDICVGDTRSVSGIFRALRNIPLMLSICDDIRHLCPNAVFLNYTNPMSMLCKAMQTLYPDVDVTGLCHSVQGTAEMLASWLGVDYEKMTYTCLGVNHQAFFTELRENGKDLYPRLREKINDPEYYNKEQVRNEIFKTFGYYVTESSGHNSEYCAWFRKRPDLIERFCTHGTNWNPGVHGFSLAIHSDPDRLSRDVAEWNAKPVDTKRGHEYAASILNARIGDGTPFHFNANLLNNGSIENLPYDACVELPVKATKDGYVRTYHGKMPSSPAVLVSYTAGIENLVFEAFCEKSKAKVIVAVAMDPLCSAVLSLDEVTAMCEELFTANADFLADYQ